MIEKTHIVLTGFMGTGKSAVGKLLARLLRRRVVDIDRMIERKAHLSVAKIFQKEGEKFFRKLEKETIREALKKERCVIITGGGAVIDKTNRVRLRRQGIVIRLKASPRTIWNRVLDKKSRPLLMVKEPYKVMTRLMKIRERHYQDCDMSVDTTHTPPRLIAKKITSLLKRRKDFIL